MACKVLVVCGSPVVASADLLQQLAGECDHIVAVDRGLDALLRRTDMGAARQEKNDTPEKETGTEHAPLLLPLSHIP